MHGTSHWLGLDVHDVGAYMRDGKARPLEPGMVITIEPGLYIPAQGIGIRIEDDVAITDGAPDVLTATCPKQVGDIEVAIRG
jgi:Xaa-Pro aminopeptidase